jgi:hypothetical protein
MRSNMTFLVSIVAVSATILFVGERFAKADCNPEGDTCETAWLENPTTVEVYGPSTGDDRNVRTWINGVYQGQFESTDYSWSFSVPHNSVFSAAVQSCWSGFLSSTCHGWAVASPDPILTPPNARTFKDKELTSVLFNSDFPDGACLDLPDSKTANGTRLEIYDCNGGANQHWTLESDGTIHSKLDSSKCLDLPDWNTSAIPDIWDCNGGTNQIWSYNSDDTISGYYGLCLEVPGSGGPGPVPPGARTVDYSACYSLQQWTTK